MECSATININKLEPEQIVDKTVEYVHQLFTDAGVTVNAEDIKAYLTGTANPELVTSLTAQIGADGVALLRSTR